MSLLIDSEIYDWLRSFQLVKGTQASQKLPSGKVTFDESASNQFLNGTIFAKLFQKLTSTPSKLSEKAHLDHASTESLTTAVSPSSKLYNWNLIYENLKKLNINIDKDVKALIAAGDNDMINDILHELHKKFKKRSNVKTINLLSKSGLTFQRTRARSRKSFSIRALICKQVV